MNTSEYKLFIRSDISLITTALCQCGKQNNMIVYFKVNNNKNPWI